jgi:hypothetical protein
VIVVILENMKEKNLQNYRVGVIVFSASFNNISVISWWSVLLVEEIGENH